MKVGWTMTTVLITAPDANETSLMGDARIDEISGSEETTADLAPEADVVVVSAIPPSLTNVVWYDRRRSWMTWMKCTRLTLLACAAGLLLTTAACSGASSPGDTAADVASTDGGDLGGTPDVQNKPDIPDTSGDADAGPSDGDAAAETSCECNGPPGPCWASEGECVDGECVYEPRSAGSCDDSDPCTTDDACDGQGACAGQLLVCDVPPTSTCTDDATLQVWASPGLCSEGACEYALAEVACPIGCADGVCTGDPCANVTCDSPPGPCYAAAGQCSAGACNYVPLDGASCDDGDACTNDDSCSSGVCAGIATSCQEPPAPTCLDPSTVQAYEGNGTCAAGDCTYAAVTANCSQGCADGACMGDPCAGVACDTPPGPCYAATGTCNGGACSYTSEDDGSCDDGDTCTVGDTCIAGSCQGTPQTCNDPPTNTCKDANTLVAWSDAGSCQTGTCDYASVEVACPTGCDAGACVGDPCQGVVCDQPPSTCHATAGACISGTCSYALLNGDACDDGDPCTTADTCSTGSCLGTAVVCDAPPASECEDADTLTSWGAGGTCQADGSCQYDATSESCAFGCAAGACSVPTGVVISEVYYDAVGADDDTFVEVHGPAGLSLDGFTLYGVNGNNGSTYQTITLSGVIDSDGLFVIANSNAASWLGDEADLLDDGVDYQNGPDSVVLAWDGHVVDAVAYGSFDADETAAGEGTPAAAAPAGQSLARDDAFTDTDDNATDFVAGTPTPGAGPGPGCTDACAQDAKQCEGALVQACVMGASGCLEWSAATACPGDQSCTGAGLCGLVISSNVELCGEHIVDGPFAVQGGATVTCPTGSLVIRATSIFVDPGSAIDLSGTSTLASGSVFRQCSGSCNANGVGAGAGGGGNATVGGNGSATQFEVKSPPCGGWWGWSCTSCSGASGGDVRGLAHTLEPALGGRGGNGCTSNGYGGSSSCLGDWLLGGNGGGTVELYASESITLLGTVDVSGDAGSPGPDGEPDIGAGGGAGGTAVIVGPEVVINGYVRAFGGSGSYGEDYITGDCADTVSTGGAGGDGWIKVAHGASYSADSDAFDGGVVVTSFMPPLSISSPTHPDLSLHYNDTLGPIELVWAPPVGETESWFWRLTQDSNGAVDAGNGVYTSTPSITLDPADITAPGTWYVHIVSVSSGAQIGTIRSSAAIHVNATPPTLSSQSHPNQNVWYEDPAKEVVAMSWSSPTNVDPASFAGYWYRLDHSAVAEPGKAVDGWTFTTNSQVIVTEDAAGTPTGPGTWYFHIVSEDTLGNLTTTASTWRIQLGVEPSTTSFYGYVEDSAGDPVVGATMTLQPYDLKVMTVDAGYFLIPDMYEGTYSIIVEAIGLSTLATSVELNATTSPVTLTMP